MTSGARATCNNGKVCAQSLPPHDQEPCYTSQLHVMVSLDMIGKTIECIYDNGTTTEEIGNFTIDQCNTMTIIKVAPSTGKLVICVGNLIYKTVLTLSSYFSVCKDSNHCLQKHCQI